MSYFNYTRSRSRERSLFDNDDPFYSRPLVRRNTKRSRVITLSDDEDNGHDDYPYSTTHQPSRLSRALTIRKEPSQLEKYNVWSYDKPSHRDDHDSDSEHHHHHRYRYTTKHYHHDGHHDHHRHSHHHHHNDDSDRDEFRLKLRATFSKPSSSSKEVSSSSFWPGTMFRRREKLTNVDWETNERSRSRSRSRDRRRDSFFDDDDDMFKEKSVRYRKIKRTRTDEWKPLSGFRRY